MTRVEGRSARRFVFPLLLAFLLGVSLTAEFRSYIRPDTGFLLDAAARVLDGERLYLDVVEINPPLIIGLNMAVVAAARLLGISEILAYRLGFSILLLAALVLAAWQIRRLFPREPALHRWFVLLLAFVLFPLAAQDFGEREHLVLALVVPYLLLVTARSLGRKVPPPQAIALGLLAGLAFALKPHFLLVWIGAEAWLRLVRRVAPRALLPETVSIAGFLVTYGIAILILTPRYLDLVRLLAGPYSRFLYDPFLHVLVTGPGAVLAIFAVLAFAALRPQARHRELWSAVAIATAACLLAGAAQQKGLRYHFYPSFGLGTVLLGLIAWDVARPLGNRLRAVYHTLAAGVLAATVAVVCVQNAAVALGSGQDSDRAQFEELVRLVRTRAPGQSVMVMSYHIRSAYPMINYAGARSASRFPQLWILAAEYLDQLGGDAPLRYHADSEMSPSERYLNQAVLGDLKTHQPRLLIVFKPARDLPVNGLRRIDYLAYFGRDPRFEEIFREYEFVADLGDYLVYQRIQPGAARSGPPPAPTPGTQDITTVRESGVRLRLADPSLLVALAAFLAGLLAAWIGERRRVAVGSAGGSE